MIYARARARSRARDTVREGTITVRAVELCAGNFFFYPVRRRAMGDNDESGGAQPWPRKRKKTGTDKSCKKKKKYDQNYEEILN